MKKTALKKRKKKGPVVMVKCDGNPSSHKCEERKCRHRKPHVMRGRCGKRLHNQSDRWCTMPGTVSPQDGNVDGALVTCVPVEEKK